MAALADEDIPETRWRALLIGGVSGTGKSTAARAVGLRLGVSWLGLDQIRLAFQHSGARLPDARDNEALYLFWDRPDVFRQPPEELCAGLIGNGRALAPAVEIVTASSLDHVGPLILEGDGIIPAALERPMLRERVAAGEVAAVFVIEPDEATLLATIVGRGRGTEGRPAAEQRAEARAKWLFGQWLVGEAGRLGLPVVASRPWATLADRILATVAR